MTDNYCFRCFQKIVPDEGPFVCCQNCQRIYHLEHFEDACSSCGHTKTSPIIPLPTKENPAVVRNPIRKQRTKLPKLRPWQYLSTLLIIGLLSVGLIGIVHPDIFNFITGDPTPRSVSEITNTPDVNVSGTDNEATQIPTSTSPSSKPTSLPSSTPQPTNTRRPRPSPTTKPPSPSRTPTRTPATPQTDSFSIGTSVNDHEIRVHQFGDGSRSIVLIGGIHAGFAPSSVDISNRLINYFSDNPNVIPSNTTIYILPIVNPDSYYDTRDPGEEGGRVNGNNVDLNRNWDCNWSKTAIWSHGSQRIEVYGGSRAFSEPETKALRDFLLDLDPEAVIFFDARHELGRVYRSKCFSNESASLPLAQQYSDGSGYGINPLFMGQGEAADWLAAKNVPAVFVLLKQYSTISNSEWRNHLNGVLEVIDYYSR